MDSRNHGGFTESFKRQVVAEVEGGCINKTDASKRYGILGHSTITKWCRRYGRMSENFRKEPVQVHTLNEKDRDFIRLKNENKALKKELKHAKMKALTMETMVEVAEEEFGISIRKKHGAKQ